MSSAPGPAAEPRPSRLREVTTLVVQAAAALAVTAWLLWLVVVVSPETGVTMAVVAVPIGLLAMVGRRRLLRRRRAFRAWAAERGWAYSDHSAVLVGRWISWPFRGAGRTATDVLTAVVDGVTVTSFTHGGSLSPRARRQGARGWHVVVTTLPTAFPPLVVTPENRYTRTADAIGVRDLQTESAEFNARWRVVGADVRFAHAVLQPRLMARLLEPDVEGMSLLVEGRDVAVFAPGRTELLQVEPRAALLGELARLVPRYIPDDHPAPVLTRRPRSGRKR